MSLPNDYPQLQYMVPATGASEYQFEIHPVMDHWFEHINESIPVENGTTKQYHRAFKFMCKCIWSDQMRIGKDQYGMFRQIFNLHTAMTFLPCPLTHPAASYAVQWQGGLDFHIVSGMTQIGYSGSLSFSLLIKTNSIYTSTVYMIFTLLGLTNTFIKLYDI